MSQMNSSMNFLPEDYVEKRQAARAAVVFIGLLLVVVGGIVGAYFFTIWNNAPIFAQQASVTAQYEKASEDIKKAGELEAQRERMVAKAETTTTLMEKVRRSALLSELTRLRPKNVNFVSVELKSKELPPSADQQRAMSDAEKAKRAAQGLPPEIVKPPEVEVTVDLIATAPTDAEVAAYMAALQKSTLLTGVNLLFSEEFKKTKEDSSAGDILRKFHVEMMIDPKADLRGNGAVADAAPKVEK